MESLVEAVELQNFGSFGNKPTRVILGTQPGLYSFYGENGHGKSTIRDAIYFGIYGESYRDGVPLARLVNWTNEKGMSVSTWIRSKSGRFRVYRTPSKQQLFELKGSGFDCEEVEVTGITDKAGFQKMVDTIYGIDSSLARELVFISSSKNRPFPLLKTAEKRTKVSSYFRLGVIGIMDGVFSNKLSTARSDLRILETSFVASETKITMATQAIDTAKAHAEMQYNQIVSRMNGEKTILEAKLQEVNIALVKAEERVGEARAKLDGAVNNVTEKKEFLEKNKKDIENDCQNKIININCKLNEIVEFNEQIDKLTNRIKQELTDNIDKLTTGRSKLIEQNDKLTTELNEKLQELYGHYGQSDALITTKISENIEKIKDLELQISGLDSEIGRLRTEFMQCESDNADKLDEQVCKTKIETSNNLKADLKLITSDALRLKEEKDWLNSSEICFKCKSVLTPEHKSEEIARLSAEFDELKNKRESLVKSISEIDAYLSEREQAVALRGSLSEKLRELQTARQTLQNTLDRHKSIDFEGERDLLKSKYENSKSSLRELYNSKLVTVEPLELLEARETKLAELKIAELESTRKVFDADKYKSDIEIERLQRLDAIPDYVGEANKLVIDAERELARVSGDLENIKSGFVTCTDSVKAKEKEILEIVVDKSLVNKAVEDCAKYKEEHGELEAKISEKRKRVSILEEIRDVLSDEGAKQTFIKRFVTALNSRVNHHLHYYGMPTTVEFDELLELILHNSASVKPVVYAQHSGGEQRRLAISILMSMVELSMEMMSWRSGFMFLDEFLDEGMDDNGMSDTFDILKTYAERRGIRLYVISHKITGDYFVGKFKIEKKNGFSHVRSAQDGINMLE